VMADGNPTSTASQAHELDEAWEMVVKTQVTPGHLGLRYS